MDMRESILCAGKYLGRMKKVTLNTLTNRQVDSTIRPILSGGVIWQPQQLSKVVFGPELPASHIPTKYLRILLISSQIKTAIIYTRRSSITCGFQSTSAKAAFPTAVAPEIIKHHVSPRRVRRMFTHTITVMRQIERPRKKTCSPATPSPTPQPPSAP